MTKLQWAIRYRDVSALVAEKDFAMSLIAWEACQQRGFKISGLWHLHRLNVDYNG